MTDYNDEFIYAKITLKDRATPATTLDFYFSSRVVQNDSVPFRFKPLLKAFNVGGGVSGYIPKQNSGSVIIDNSYSNIRNQKRLSDYFLEYEIINQSIEFYVAYDTDDLTTDGNLIWKDIITNFSNPKQSDVLTLTLRSSVLPKDIVNYELTNEWLGGLQGSLGKAVPFIVGEDIEVKPIAMGDGGFSGYNRDFAYATILNDDFVVGGVQKYKAKDDKDEYVEIANPADTDTALYQWANDSSGGYVGLHDGEMASRVNYDSSNIYIATQLRIRCEGASANIGRTIEGEIVARIYKRRALTGKPTSQHIDEIRIAKTSIAGSAWESSTEFIVGFDLTNPLVMSHENGYFVSLQVTNSPDGGKLRACTRDETGRVIQYRNDPDRDNKDSWQAGDVTSGTTQETAHTFIMNFKGIEFVDYPDGSSGAYVNDKGLAPAYFRAQTASYNYSLDADRYNLKDLDLIVEVDGIKDNAGAIAGGGYSGVITAGTHVIKLLTYEWSGTAWTDSNTYSSTLHSSTHGETDQSITPIYLRVLSGATSGKIRKDALIAEFARNLQCMVCPMGNQKFGLFFIGASVSASETFLMNDIKTISYAGSEQGTIVNEALMFYDKKVEDTNKGLTLFDQQQRNYNKFKLYSYNDGGTGEGLSEDSEALYGIKQLSRNEFDWIQHDASADNVLKVILRRHDMAFQFTVIEIPDFKFANSELTSLDIGSIINIKTPELPSDDGTTTNNNFNPASETNIQDNYRADTIKAQITDRAYIKNSNEHLKIKYTARIILSTQDVT